MKTKSCSKCGSKHRDIYLLCQKCMEKEGGQYTASNFDLSDLDQVERQLVFLWACGKDISGYLDKTNHEVYVPDNEDLSELLSYLHVAPHYSWEYTKFMRSQNDRK